jgi:outer membrane protein assembly factor BamB
MTRLGWLPGVFVVCAACAAEPPSAEVASSIDGQADGHGERCEWTQWGRSADHDSQICARAEAPERLLAHRTMDPLVGEDGDPFRGPLAHLQVPLSDDDGRVFVMERTGVFGDPTTHVWHQRGLRWRHGALEERWTFASDFRASPIAGADGALFQAALGDHTLWVPGAGGTLWKLDKHTGHVRGRVNPFGSAIDPDIYIHGGVTIDRHGNVYYSAVKLDPVNPRTADVLGAWLVRVSAHGRVRKVDYTRLIPGAPAASDPCYLTFRALVPRPPFPWPPVSPALPPQTACLSQRPPLDASPAVGADGTVFVVTRAHAADNYSYMVALRPDLSLRWATSMRGLLNDGCGGLAVPACRDGATPGVDPETNLPPAGRANDGSSSAPVALPDGGVVFGAYTGYNGARGHLLKLDRHGGFAGSFDFGWDSTPGVWRHDGTYSLVVKDNYYFDGIYFVTQVDANLEEEWEFEATNTLACEHLPDGTISCEDFFAPFEWCVASPGIDRDGTVFVTNADGNLYAIAQGGVEQARFFLDRTAFAAYTPTALDSRGRIYALNNGQLFVVGE